MIEIIKKHSRLTLVFLALTASSAALAAEKLNLPVDRHGFFKVSGETFRHPTTAKIREAISAANPHVEKLPGGGLSQSLPANIEITATKQTSPISAKVKVGAQALKNGSKNLLRGGLAGLVLTAGLEKLFDGIDALIEDGQVVQKKPVDISDPPSGASWSNSIIQVNNSSPPACSTLGGCFLTKAEPIGYNPDGSISGMRYYFCSNYSAPSKTAPFIGFHSNYSPPRCYFLPGATPGAGMKNVPMSDSEIDDAVDNFYEPEPEDWNLLARYVDPSAPDVYAEISNIPSLLTPPTTKTIYDADGNPVEIQETNIWYDFDIIDNNSKQPAIDIKENKETKTYDSEGNLKGTEKTQSTSKAGSSSASSSGNLEIPTDCAFMPTVCAFLDWFKTDTQVEVKEFSEEASTFQERDFFGEPVPTFQESLELMNDGIKNAPIAQALSNISFPTGGSCPTGTTSINIAGKNIQLTFESHCDLWELIAPIISAAFLALWAVIAVRVFLSA